jgi:hypothetical protein
MFPVSVIAHRKLASAPVDATGRTIGFVSTMTMAKWRASHSSYWREYRAAHPAYRERNRGMQRLRNSRRNFEPIANMDVTVSPQPLGSGFYVLCDAHEAGVANMNAWTVHIAVLSAPTAPPI